MAMANRDVGIALSGVVVGVLLGAGSILYAQGAALGADTFAYTPYDYSARKLNRDSVEKHNKEQMKKAAPTQVVPTIADIVDSKTCKGAQALKAALEKILPQNDYRYLEEWAKINTAVDAVCGNMVKPAAPVDDATGIVPVKKTETKYVDNDCEKFTVGGPRYAACMGAEAQGQQYW